MTALGDKARTKADTKIKKLDVVGSFSTPGTPDPTTGTVSGSTTVSNVSTTPPLPVDKNLVGQGGIQAVDWVIYLAAIEAEAKSVTVVQGMSITVSSRSGKVEGITEYRADDRIAAYEIRCR